MKKTNYTKVLKRAGAVLTLMIAFAAIATLPRCGSGIGAIYSGKAKATKF